MSIKIEAKYDTNIFNRTKHYKLNKYKPTKSYDNKGHLTNMNLINYSNGVKDLN